MNITLENSTHIGMGYATLADAFQCGREAAQMAKGQIPEGEFSAVLVFGPSGIHFKDFIDGARLVTGNDKLIGIPVNWVLSNDLASLDSCVVLIIQSTSMQFTVVSSGPQPKNLLTEITSVLSECRQKRGNNRKLFDYSGLLLFHNIISQPQNLAHQLTADMSLDAWILGMTASSKEASPLVFEDTLITRGLVAMECLSPSPWGLSSVGLDSFKKEKDVYRESVKTILRDATSQLQGNKPLFGFLFCDFPGDKISRDDLWDIFHSAESKSHNFPLIVLPCGNPFTRGQDRALSMHKHSIACCLLPS
jgi:hypothetical protein